MRYEVLLISAEGSVLSNGPLYVASLLISHNYTVKTLQCLNLMEDHQIESLVNEFVKDERQVIGISVTFMRTKQSIDAITKFIKLSQAIAPGIRFVVGGTNHQYNPSMFPSGKTSFVLGQNRENEIVDTFNRLTGKIVKKPFNFVNHSIDYDALFDTPVPGVIMFLEISKGCIFNCTFCNYSLRKTKSQYKSKEQILNEIEKFHSKFGTSEIFITCSTFNDDEDKIAVLNEVAESLSFVPRFFAYTRFDLFMTQSERTINFYKKYVKYVMFGVESFSSETLRMIHKMPNVDKMKNFLRDFRKGAGADIHISVSLICGLPNETYESVKSGVDWLIQEDIADRILVNPLRINPIGSSRLGLNEFSEFDQHPEKYGFSVFEHSTANYGNDGKFNDSQIYSWVRDDGYTSEQSILDTIKLNSQIENPVGFIAVMQAKAKGKSLSKDKEQRNSIFYLTNITDNQNVSANKKEEWEIENEFVQSYYESLMKNSK